jgi:hypothetical protein
LRPLKTILFYFISFFPIIFFHIRKGDLRMKKSFIAVLAVFAALMFISPSMACEGPNCSASGNFDIDVSAIGGGLSADLIGIRNGSAGGVGVAGGIASGQAEGGFSSFFGIPLGSTEANIGVTAGGVSKTETGIFWPNGIDFGIGLFSNTNTFATVAGHVDGDVFGLAAAEGSFVGAAGQGSIDSSTLFDRPQMWGSHAMTTGAASQGSFGDIAGFGGAVLCGSFDVDAYINMTGNTYSESYRGINFFDGGCIEILGTNVGASTLITSGSDVDRNGFAAAGAGGGFTTAGGISALTTQASDSGMAVAAISGGYAGRGNLGCNLNLNAIGSTQTSYTQYTGYNGSIMSSSAGVSVSSNSVSD